MKAYKQLGYDVIDATVNHGIKDHPQTQMEKLGYKVIGSVPQTLGDCWWFTVEDLMLPMPSYLTEISYNFEYWHGMCWENCEHFKENSRCCYGGLNCVKEKENE